MERRQQNNVKPTGLISLKTSPQFCVASKTVFQVKEAGSDITIDGYKPFIWEGILLLSVTNSQPPPIAILQDMGASPSCQILKVLINFASDWVNNPSLAS